MCQLVFGVLMLLPHLRLLNSLSVHVQPSEFAEDLEKSTLTPAEYCEATAILKAVDVYTKRISDGEIPDLVIGSDAIVEIDGMILEKPTSPTHAVEMLQRLSGRVNNVYSGVALIIPKKPGISVPSQDLYQCVTDRLPDNFDGQIVYFHEKTGVKFASLTRELIDAYIATGEPFDKAGGYGYQTLAGTFIERIDGCYHNVVGFPLYRFCAAVEELINNEQII